MPNEQEIFEYMSLAYNVTEAKALVTGREAEGEICPVQWKEWISREINRGAGKIGFTLGIRVNRDHVAKVDLEDPIIVAQVQLQSTTIPLPIDGWHRIQKAIDEGREVIQAHYLSLKDSEAVRIR